MAQTIFLSTTMKSPDSLVARVMTALGLTKVAYFVLRGGTPDQRDYLSRLLGDTVVACLPLHSKLHPNSHRQMWILSAVRPSISDIQYIEDYEAILHHVFGSSCRIRVRIMWTTAKEKSCKKEK